MIKFHSCPQGSDEWHEMRSNFIGSSDAAVLMQCGYMTEKELYDNKLGLFTQSETPAMRRGKDLEDEARQAYDWEAVPAVVTNSNYPWAMASLDGITPNGRIVEIKTGGKKTEDMVMSGKIPDNHFAQCQHIMMVMDAVSMDYAFYTGDELYVQSIGRDSDYISKLVEKEKSFYQRMMTFDSPEDKYLEIEDEEHLAMIKEYVFQSEALKFQKEAVEALRDKIIERCNGRSMTGAGVKIMKQERKGAVDYKAIPELQGVDLEKYRKEAQTVWVLK